ncbi:hypothetical protein ACIQZI_12525 [Peribacillus sp. NPDC096379]
MSQNEREFYIEWLAMKGEYEKSLYVKMKDPELEYYYKELLEPNK